MGNKHPQNIEKEDYENCCETFKDFLSELKNDLELEKEKNNIVLKIDNKAKKNLIFHFIRNLLEREKKEKILNKMQEIFVYLFEHYEKIHRKEEDKFSDYVDNNEKNIINAIYISKMLEDDFEDIKIHDYAVYLYGEDCVNEIENGNNKNIDENFKKFYNEDFETTEDEINAKFFEICKEKNIDPEKYEIQENPIQQINENEPKNNIEKNVISKKNIYEYDYNLNKNKYRDCDILGYYDIVIEIDFLENLIRNGWEVYNTERGYIKYREKKIKIIH